MGEEAQVSVFAVMASWLTPSYLFIFLNLVIATIVIITSRFSTTRKRKLDSPAQLGHYKYEETQPAVEPARLDRAPSSSLLDPVKSLNLGLYKIEKQEVPGPDSDDPTRNRLAGAPSLLERLLSVKFQRSEEKEPEPEPEPEPGPGGDLVERKEEEEEEGVDAKADDFIKRFKQQLRLQRLDSILRYRDMFQRY